jgi:D-amino-acid dehydrogenase
MTEGGRGPSRIAVIGAGIVGMSTACFLQEDGHEVVVLDPRSPGEGCSLGNAGVLHFGLCAPLGTPEILAQIPVMLATPLSPVAIRWRYLPKLMPWLWHFAWASRPARIEEISIALRALLARAREAHETLIELAEARDLFRSSGWLFVYETERAFKRDARERMMFERRGVPFQLLNGEEIARMEPSLATIFRRGLLLPGDAHIRNPLRLSQRLAARFTAKGGEILSREILTITNGGRAWRLESEEGPVEAELVVLAAGAWSKGLAAKLGAPVPLDTERGYHVMLPDSGVNLGRPVLSGEGKFVATPMEHGLRLAGTLEFGGLAAPPNEGRTDVILRRARRMLPGLKEDGLVRWMGFRPSMPDSLPVIGRSPRFDSVLLAFGHGHLGLTLGPITGRLIADLVAGRDPGLDLTPFRPERFRSRTP